MYKCKRKPRKHICAAFRTCFKAAGLRLMLWRYARVNARRKGFSACFLRKGCKRGSVFFFEHVFAYPAKRTLKIFWYLIPFCTGSYPAFGIAVFFIVHESANCANVFHVILLFSIFYRLRRCFLFQQTRDQSGDLAEIVVIGVP